MPDLRFKPERAKFTEIPRPKRAEGQWALGYTEPLRSEEHTSELQSRFGISYAVF